MRADSYEATLAYVNNLNRRPRKYSMLQQIVWFFGCLAEAGRTASDYERLTNRGVAPEIAVRRAFGAAKR